MATEQKNQQLTEILAGMAASCETRIDDDMRNCMIEQANKVQGSDCDIKAFLITSPECGGCEESKEELKDFLDSGQVSILDSGGDLAYSLMQQADSEGLVPMLVLADCDGNLLGELEIYPSEIIEEAPNGSVVQDQT